VFSRLSNKGMEVESDCTAIPICSTFNMMLFKILLLSKQGFLKVYILS
jgi:hypothetical protein